MEEAQEQVGTLGEQLANWLMAGSVKRLALISAPGLQAWEAISTLRSRWTMLKGLLLWS